MKIYNASIEQIDEALQKLNRKYQGNITYKNFEMKPKYAIVTLKVLDSEKPGAKENAINRKSKKPKKLKNACFHAHGDFFDLLLHLEPRCFVYANNLRIHNVSDNLGEVVEYARNNWLDWNNRIVGKMESECCSCETGGKFYEINYEQTYN